LITQAEGCLNVLKTAHLLGQEWDKNSGRSKIAFPIAVLFRSWFQMEADLASGVRL
jgi:hypothetical protein